MIEFIASLPPIQSAITLDGMGDGGRVKLDVSRPYVDALIKLQGLAGQSIRVIVQALDEPDKLELTDLQEMVKIDG